MLGDLNALLQTNRRLHSLLTSTLYDFAIRLPSKYGHYALLSVAMNGNEKLVKLLVENGLNGPVKNFEDISKRYSLPSLKHGQPTKFTVLHLAAMKGNETAVRLILETGATDINAQGYMGKTALSMAASREEDTGPLELLLRKGADVNTRDFFNGTALHWAAKHSPQATKILLEAGMDPNDRDFFGRTPLHCAAQAASVEAVGMLLEKGADTSIQDREGTTPFSMCVSGSDQEYRDFASGQGITYSS